MIEFFNCHAIKNYAVSVVQQEFPANRRLSLPAAYRDRPLTKPWSTAAGLHRPDI